MERLPNRGTVRKLSRRNFLKLATAGAAVGIVTGGILNREQISSAVVEPVASAVLTPLVRYLDEEENRKRIPLRDEIKRGWAVRDNLITIKVGGFVYKYYGSNFQRSGNQVFFKHDGSYSHAFKVEPDGIKGPYSSVEFAFGNKEMCLVEVKDAQNERFELNPKLFFPEPYLTSYEFYQGSTPDYYDGLITVFTQEGDILGSKLYTREPSTIEGPHFYPQKREIFDVWTVQKTPAGLKLGQRATSKYGNGGMGDPFILILGKNQGIETLAYLYESFFLKLYSF